MSIDNANILVIDDETGMREGLRRIFTAHGHSVVTASTGTEGIALGTAMEYDLYFIDLRIGDVDGEEVLSAIKNKFPEAICIIITGYASIETAVMTTRLGAYYYVTKPFMPDEIELLLQRALERRADILETRRLRAEQAKRLLEVAQEKSRIRTIVQSLDDGVLVMNQQGEAVFVNPRFLSLLDIQCEAPIGQNIHPLLPKPLSDQINEILLKKETLSSLRQEIIIHPPANLVIMANTTPIVDDAGELIGVVSVLRDISELKQLELLKSQFVNMAAHELKAPLTAIQGYLEMVLDRTLGDDQATYDEYLRRSHERIKALIQLINDLLNISRMQAGKIRREIQLLDLAEILRGLLEFYKNEIEKHQLTLVEEIVAPLPVEADREEMQRVFSNLISNAIKYNRPSGNIRVTAAIEGRNVRVQVSDSGIGMTPEEKARVFEEFFRAKNAYTRQITGTGLGLAIVKKTVDLYAGKVTVDSVFQQGTTFTVYLPLAQKN